jgi:hypothetical protein
MLIVNALINNQSTVDPGSTIRSVKATLHHLSGETSEIVMLIPRYTDWGEYMEDANNSLVEYVNVLTRHWIQISHFETEIGKYNAKGEFIQSWPSQEHAVPVDKVYAAGTFGSFVKPEEHPNYPNYGPGSRCKGLERLFKLVAERKEEVYKKVDENTTLVGIPLQSRSLYFDTREEEPKQFLLNNQRYLVVYQINNFAQPTQ